MADFLQIKVENETPLRDVVFQTLRKAILTGDLKPGERLMEIHLAKRMGVSRTPVREAIRMLELEDLVTMVPRCGAKVSNITAAGLKDVLEVRESLDELAISLACERITDENLKKLKEAMVRFESAIASKSLVRIAQADEKFHNIIANASGNKKLVQLVSNLSEQVYRYRYECIKDESMHDELILEHKEMFESIYSKDKKRAANAVKMHIDRQRQVIIHNLHLEDGK